MSMYTKLSIGPTALDIENKIASFDVLTFKEVIELKLRNRHRIYVNKHCLWCGEKINIDSRKKEKKKSYCTSYCFRNYRNFTKRIMEMGSRSQRVKRFVEFCLVRLILREPAIHLAKQMRKACHFEKNNDLICLQTT